MTLSQRQLDVLNHVVEDGQAWADNAKKEEYVLQKIAKYEADYDASVLVGNYRNRMQRDADELIANTPDPMFRWLIDMETSDRTMLSRHWEEYFDINGTDGWPQATIDKYDSKKALRLKKP